ncbi:transposase family protein [Wolbachia endosymbiont of Drosophila ananassae]|nr:transposase family protein [Wolbachia endosymbiont of Drosophila ananassae]RLT63206.1 transposase family protein [Wolbachia endosymbiont of Drosophila ananassae]
MELLASIQKKSYFSLMNHGLAHIQRLDMGGLKRGLEHRLKQN